MLINAAVDQTPTALPADLSLSSPPGETIRHILLGSPGGIRQTVHLLHNLRYVEIGQWSPPIAVPDGRLILSPNPGEVISLVMKRL